MITLLFNSNYLSVVLPPGEHVATHCRVGSTFTLRCIYACWRVTDLYQEWGIDDFPAETAAWAVSFLASPHTEVSSAEAGPYTSRVDTGELYFTALHPTQNPGDPIYVLCIADSDRQYFGVSTSEESSALFAEGEPYTRQVWLPVRIEGIDRVDLNEAGPVEEIAHLVIDGEPVRDWTRAVVDSIPR
jgi:hypothetical protein